MWDIYRISFLLKLWDASGLDIIFWIMNLMCNFELNDLSKLGIIYMGVSCVAGCWLPSNDWLPSVSLPWSFRQQAYCVSSRTNIATAWTILENNSLLSPHYFSLTNRVPCLTGICDYLHLIFKSCIHKTYAVPANVSQNSALQSTRLEMHRQSPCLPFNMNSCYWFKPLLQYQPDNFSPRHLDQYSIIHNVFIFTLSWLYNATMICFNGSG